MRIMKRKRILAVLTVLTMLIGLLPMTASAAKTATNLQNLRDYLTGSTSGYDLITLEADITLGASDACIEVNNRDHILDLNGHVIRRKDATGKKDGAGSIFKLTSKHTLTIKDSDPSVEHEGYVDENGLWHIGEAPNGETPVTIYGGLITGGYDESTKASYGGAISFKSSVTGTNLIIEGGNIVGNYSKCGGAIYVDKLFTMNGGLIAYNTGAAGGAYIAKGTTNIEGGSIEHNTGTTVGGIYTVTGSTLNINGGSISYNTGATGGIYASGSSAMVYVNGGSISYNTGITGGGVFGDSGHIYMKESASITNNTALQGGGVMISDGELEMTKGEIAYNTAKCENDEYGDGGGVYACEGSTVSLYPDASVDNNYAEHDGGGVFTDNATYIGCSVENNTAGHDGGGIYMNEQSDSLGCYMGHYDEYGYYDNDICAGSVKNNTAGNNGGGIYVNKARFEFIKGSVENNTAGNNGGGIYAVGSMDYDFLLKYANSPEETECFIRDNSAVNDGGGMYLDATEEDFLSACITYATIENNTCDGNGAGVAFMSKEGDVDIETMWYYGADVGKLSLYGAPIINNNKTTKNVPSNLYFNVPNKLALSFYDYNVLDKLCSPEEWMDVGITIEGDTKTLNYDANYMDIFDQVGDGDSFQRSDCEAQDWETTYDLDEILPYLHSDDIAYKIEHKTASDEGTDYWGNTYTVTYNYYDMASRENIPFFDFGEGSAPDFDYQTGIPTTIPGYENMPFAGWFTAKDGGELVHDGTDFKNGYSEFTIGETYYAHWAMADGAAKIGETQYETLAEAVAAAVVSGEVVVLLDDNSENISLAKEQSFKLDTNEYTFDGEVTTSDEADDYKIDEVTIDGITIYTAALPYIRTSVANNDSSCLVSVHPFRIYSALFIAGYKGGKLVYLEQDSPESEGYEDDGIETYSLDSELDAIKIFAWDIDNNFEPSCKANVILQNEWK